MKSIHLFSPEKDRKIAWFGSVAFMILAWLFLASLWVWIIVRAWLQSYFDAWTIGAYIMMAVYLFVLIMIPVQIRRYVRKSRQ
jgi:hypothetical protein